MVSINQIESFCRRIGDEFGAERIVLFGSYADGSATENSDVDLLVVADTSLAPHKRYAAVRHLVADLPLGFDIIVKTPAEYARCRSVINNVVYFADKYGRVVYER
jgi:predicted nucleotidyltransferase